MRQQQPKETEPPFERSRRPDFIGAFRTLRAARSRLTVQQALVFFLIAEGGCVARSRLLLTEQLSETVLTTALRTLEGLIAEESVFGNKKLYYSLTPEGKALIAKLTKGEERPS